MTSNYSPGGKYAWMTYKAIRESKSNQQPVKSNLIFTSLWLINWLFWIGLIIYLISKIV